MKFRSFFALLAILLVMASQACSNNASEAQNALEGDILFQDDFSQKGTWDEGEDEDGKAFYHADQNYHILVKAANANIWSNPGLNFKDVRIEVDATKIEGPEENEFGVICRYLDSRNFYYFAITSDGYFGIFKVKDGTNIMINRTEWMPSTAIKKQADKNQIRAECVGSTLKLFVNGQFLDKQEDADFKSGDVGLIAGTTEPGGVEILFDNFVVRKP